MAKKVTANLAIGGAIQQLKQEHLRLSKELARVNQALAALGGLKAGTGAAASSLLRSRPKRKVSAAARKKMAAAARARWAAFRKEKGQAKGAGQTK